MRLGNVEIMIVTGLVFWVIGAAASLFILEWVLDSAEPIAVAIDLVQDLLIPLSHPLRW